MVHQIDHIAVKAILNVLRRKIARRTSEDEAIDMLSRFILELTPKYEFLKYISVNQTVYSESESIWVAPELNEVEEKQMLSALHDLVRKSVVEMKEKADFFFIREFQDAFEDIEPVKKTITDDIPLNIMQHEYLVNRAQTLSLEKNQLLINLIYVLLSIENSYLPERESVELMQQSLQELLPKFPFFYSIEIIKNPEEKGYYTVEITDDVQKIPTYQFADAIYQLILHIGTKLQIEDSEEYRNKLKYKLGKRNTELLQKLNVPINNLHITTSSFSKKDILNQLIDALIIIIGERTSKLFAVAVMIKIMGNVKQANTLFSDIQIQKNQEKYNLFIYDTIESASDEEFRKSIKKLIESVGAHLGQKRGEFISSLKLKLGEDYVSTIENYGLNFHMLEMRFD